jgi:hypothetical protein
MTPPDAAKARAFLAIRSIIMVERLAVSPNISLYSRAFTAVWIAMEPGMKNTFGRSKNACPAMGL